ncbi:LysR substrate-binding domain-containing protein [Spiribacter halobius]|uniref:LysR family transcriptional regulator n=1 Tax=Sediminicurvatus halobius TaxID=2182432 RepID=A0A2U2MYQ8_9GAMM|nr:LysR substrate-binding domain-containing protein [Spiribacter halobius]PWG62131.1 LysR family transcriptional regulator [Spiribacter halobius]UEX77185.1 LysR family transcriptional regulator [Spiribacter halobius]
MGRPLPSPLALHAFDAAARHMSFTEAARELGVTQAAVSQRIQVLEHQLGQRLFVRHPRALALTEAGRALMPSVREAFERLAGGVDEVFGPAREAPLTVRATPGFIELWLAPRLHRFRAEHPQVPLRLASAIWPEDFTGDGVDLEIRYGVGDWTDVESLALAAEGLTPVCSPRLAGKLDGPGDLAGHTLLHAAGFESGWRHWLNAAGAGDLADHAEALVCDTLAATHALARHHVGVALGRRSLLPEALADGRLVAPFPQVLDSPEGFYLTRPARKPLRPEATAFWDWAAEQS